MQESFLETPIGQGLRLLGGHRYLRYPEETDGFQVPQDSISIASRRSHDNVSEHSREDHQRDSRGSSLPSSHRNSLRQSYDDSDSSSHDNSPQSSQNNSSRSRRYLSFITAYSIDSLSSHNSSTHSLSSISSGSTHYTTPDEDLESQIGVEPKDETPSQSGVFVHQLSEKLSDSTEQGDLLLVGWYGDTDVFNPRNFSPAKKAWVTFVICLYTFVVYCASAIFVPSTEYLIRRYDVSITLASLGLAIYVVGYGLGPMLFSPVSEIAYIGRNPPYVVSFVLFLVISVVTAVVDNFAALMVLRFLQGFFGSPILASGGASLEDVYDWFQVPYAFIFWIAAMYCGPALGPLLSGYAVAADWRWPLWEVVIMAGPCVLLLIFTLPETSGPNILYRRARRLRMLTGNTAYHAPGELRHLNVGQILVDAMIKPVEIAIKDPAIAFACLYGALIYATYYSFFEAFPLVYAGIYHMSLGSIGLIFLNVIIGTTICAAIYAAYLYYFFIPRTRKYTATQESRLRPALIGVFFLPCGLFIFAWTSRADIHWIAPTIGIAVFSGSSFIVFQCLLCYVSLSYPKYVASLFAANDLCRSSLAAGFVMFSRAMFIDLGIDRGVSLLGGLSVMGILGMYYLYCFGDKLRAKSKFAAS